MFGSIVLTVLVFNYAGLPEYSLVKATEEGARILARAGIPSEWVPCDVSGKTDAEPRCRQLAAGVVMIRIHPGRCKTSPKSLGLAFASGEAPNLASVFAGSVDSLAARHGQPFEPVLARAMVHEIGHLFLGAGAHASVGVMRPEWDHGDVVKMGQGIMMFDEHQATLLRERLAQRLASR